MKRVSLECGGKSPQVFLADLEDLDRAVTYAVNGIFLTAGESCSAGSRLLVDRRIAGEFTARFIELGRDAYHAGDPLDPETNLGPLVSARQHAKVLGYVAAGRVDAALVIEPLASISARQHPEWRVIFNGAQGWKEITGGGVGR